MVEWKQIGIGSASKRIELETINSSPGLCRTDDCGRSKGRGLEKKKLHHVKEIVFEKFEEGKSIQILHMGPYSAEEPTVEKIRELMKKQDLKQNGHHHEIYISDPRKVSPEKLRTIIRYPVMPT